jgi:hypothetical protein
VFLQAQNYFKGGGRHKVSRLGSLAGHAFPPFS